MEGAGLTLWEDVPVRHSKKKKKYSENEDRNSSGVTMPLALPSYENISPISLNPV